MRLGGGFCQHACATAETRTRTPAQAQRRALPTARELRGTRFLSQTTLLLPRSYSTYICVLEGFPMMRVVCVIFFKASFRKTYGLTLFSLLLHVKYHDFSKDFPIISTL